MSYTNVYASIVQDFGCRAEDEATFLVESINLSDKVMKPRSEYRQLQVVLKGDDERTYECLKDRPDIVKEDSMDKDRCSVRKYFRELREAKLDYLDIDDDRPNYELIRRGIADSLPLMFGYEDDDWGHRQFDDQESGIDDQMQID